MYILIQLCKSFSTYSFIINLFRGKISRKVSKAVEGKVSVQFHWNYLT